MPELRTGDSASGTGQKYIRVVPGNGLRLAGGGERPKYRKEVRLCVGNILLSACLLCVVVAETFDLVLRPCVEVPGIEGWCLGHMGGPGI